MKARPWLILVLATLVPGLCAGPAPADTGTYRILDYRVKLTPHSDGAVEMEYSQTWQVTGGSIPWITVGTAGRDFEIVPEKRLGAVRSVRPETGSGWFGVRIDLDRSYGPGQTFEVGFVLRQRTLLYADGDKYRLDFTPGWYDRAEIGRLRVEMFFFAPVDTVSSNPPPSHKEGQSLIWERRDLAPGALLPISITFPRQLFPANVALASGPPGSGVSAMPWFAMIVVVTVFAGVLLLMVALSVGWRRRYGSGGDIYYGGHHHGGGGGGGGGISTGGGGGFAGRAASCVCACACAGCACACACAGGGAAGCDRKTTHSCPLCRTCTVVDCPLAPRSAV